MEDFQPMVIDPVAQGAVGETDADDASVADFSFLDNHPETSAMAQMNSGIAQILAALPALTPVQRESLGTHVHALQTRIQGLHSPGENIRAGPTPGYVARQMSNRDQLCAYLLLDVPHRPGVVCTSPHFHRLPRELRMSIFTRSMWMTRFSFVVNDITSNVGHKIIHFDNRRRNDDNGGELSEEVSRQQMGGFRTSEHCPILPCSVISYKSTDMVSIEVTHARDPAGISTTGNVEVLSAYSIGNPQEPIRRNTRHIMLVHHPAMNKVVAYEIDDEGDIIRQYNQH